jgi:hypothetical protein
MCSWNVAPKPATGNHTDYLVDPAAFIDRGEQTEDERDGRCERHRVHRQPDRNRYAAHDHISSRLVIGETHTALMANRRYLQMHID